MLGYLNKLIGKWKKKRYEAIDPEDIFIDSKNLPHFDIYQFEGRLEKSISPKVFPILGFVCLVIAGVFLFKFGSLQIANGEFYKNRSENNKLKQILLVAPRGAVYSREGQKLIWNDKTDADADFPLRKYYEESGFSNLLGFVKYPAKDKSGFYYEEEFSPKDGVELYLNEILTGRNGSKLVETAVDGSIVSQSVVRPAKDGEDVVLSIDSRVQAKLFDIIKNLAGSSGFQGGAGVIMDVESGELLALISFPEYNSEIMTEGKDVEKIESYYKDSRNPFLNRIISGLYTPGSIVKPFLAFAALEENIITPEKEIMSTGQLVVPNPYNPDKPTIFKDWKVHGAVDMRRAIAVSSDIYFYQIGGGFGDQKGLGIANIKKYLEAFGFTKKTGFDSQKEETGVIPDPEWKEKTFEGDVWRVGNTYHTAIGQYGTQITPIQAVVATSALANGGKLLTPSILFTSTSTVASGKKVSGEEKNFQIAREGMRMSITEGAASGLNTSAIKVAGKTGTAELGAYKQFVNSWIIGFWPYENPKYAFTVVMEKGPVTNLIGGTFVMRTLLDWMAVNTPEYLE
ncbi:MAG: hypothetical protein GX627_01030 [Parcubacteria group bacterium]|jgi:penicillin-binding protein 2|nr:hypothetical protein [Parcubacteria group bacterium]